MKTLHVTACALLAAGLFAGTALSREGPAQAPSLEKRVAALLPSAEEDRWLKVPWRLNLMEAITEGQRAGKPVFLWVMNGNPLGCA